MKHPGSLAVWGALVLSLAGAGWGAASLQEQEPSAPAVKPDLAALARDCFRVMKTHDIEKTLACFTDDAVYKADETTLGGKEALRDLFEFDAVNQSQVDILDLKVEGTTAVLRTAEVNESFRLLGIPAEYARTTVSFREALIERIEVESTSESKEQFIGKFEPFSTWVGERHPEEFNRLLTGGYTADNARLLLALLREWREKS
jgi:hypothetical protein